ncbi:MAG: hypothetical protein AMXMBFR75_17160 [Candidatus Hinthialibacteria bacterium]|nr:hypothetical protein [bacterium]
MNISSDITNIFSGKNQIIRSRPTPAHAGNISRKVKQQGFFLIEVLVATTLLAVGVTAALNAIFSSLRATTEARMYTEALFLAQKVMSELEAGATLNDRFVIPRSGDFRENPNFRWIASSEDIDEFWTRRISVTVIWATDARDLYNHDKTQYYRIVTEVPRPRYPEEYKK